MPQHLLNAGPEEYVDDSDALRQEIYDLKQQLIIAHGEIVTLKRTNAKAVAELRKQLTPVYSAFKLLFGEMDAIDGGEIGAIGGNAKWDAVKQRLAPRLREAVDIFLTQGSLKRTQLASAMRMDYSNCTKNVIGILLKQGLLVDNAGQLSLKEL